MYPLDLHQKTCPSLISPSVLAIRAQKIFMRLGGKSKIIPFNNAVRKGKCYDF